MKTFLFSLIFLIFLCSCNKPPTCVNRSNHFKKAKAEIEKVRNEINHVSEKIINNSIESKKNQ